MANYRARRAEIDKRFKEDTRTDTSLFLDNADRISRIQALSAVLARYYSSISILAATDMKKRLELRDILMGNSTYRKIGESDETLFDELLEETVGFGVLERIQRNDDVTDITYNGFELVLESNGQKSINETNGLVNDIYIETLVKRLLTSSTGASKDFNESKPIVDIVVGFMRLNAVHVSSAQNGMTMAIRVSKPRLVVTKETIAKMAPAYVGEMLKAFVKAQANIVIAGRTGTGKAQPVETLIPTPKGFRRLGELAIGDTVFTQDGSETKVIGVYPQGKQQIYRVTFEDGRISFCHKEHLWRIGSSVDAAYDAVMTTNALQMRLMTDTTVTVPHNGAVTFASGLVKPISTNYARGIGMSVNDSLEVDTVRNITYMPQDVREAFMQGVCDKYGKFDNTNDHRQVIIKFTTNELAQAVVTLVRSVGLIARREFGTVIIYDDTQSTVRLFASTSRKHLDKSERKGTKPESLGLKVVSVEALSEAATMVCIEVDDERHTYLTEEFIVTHNTEVTKYLISEIPFREKIALIEDVSEMHAKELFPQLDVHSWVVTGTAKATDLLKASLRNNPEWVIVTELRTGEEAIEWLEAIKSDHRSITSLHAASTYDIPSRIMGMYSEERTVDEVRFEQTIFKLLNIGVQIEAKIINGSKVRFISEVMEYRPDSQGGPILLFKQKMDIKGKSRYELNNMSPEMRERLYDSGTSVPLYDEALAAAHMM